MVLPELRMSWMVVALLLLLLLYRVASPGNQARLADRGEGAAVWPAAEPGRLVQQLEDAVPSNSVAVLTACLPRSAAVGHRPALCSC